MSPRLIRLSAIVIAATSLMGCAVGPRPTLAEDSALDAPVGEPSVDAVLAPFGALSDAVFTAHYRITNNFGAIERDATVVQAADGRRSVNVGEVRFVIEPASAVTCQPDSLEPDRMRCNAGVDDAAISDLQITHQFYGRSAAVRLRNDAERRIATPEGYQAEFADRTAHCVSVPVTGGSKVYCVLPEGILASYQGPDVLIELTGYEPVAEAHWFESHR